MASSIKEEAFITGTEYATELNQFLFMLHSAYNSHCPIVLTPDVLWLLICQGFAEHVKNFESQSELERISDDPICWPRSVRRYRETIL